MKNLIKIMFGMTIFFSAWAHAHDDIISSIPEDGAVLSESPTEITMNFSGEVRLAQVTLSSDNGETYPLDFSMSMTPKAVYEVAIEDDLSGGVYNVKWTAMGGDGHRVSGDFSFEVK